MIIIFGNSSDVSKFQELGRERKKSTGVQSKREREKKKRNEENGIEKEVEINGEGNKQNQMVKLIKIEESMGLLNREIKGGKEKKRDRRRQKVKERKMVMKDRNMWNETIR